MSPSTCFSLPFSWHVLMQIGDKKWLLIVVYNRNNNLVLISISEIATYTCIYWVTSHCSRKHRLKIVCDFQSLWPIVNAPHQRLKSLHVSRVEKKLAARVGYYIIATVTAWARKEQAIKPPRGSAKTWDSVIHYPLQLRSANADNPYLRIVDYNKAAKGNTKLRAWTYPEQRHGGLQLRKSPDWGFRT